MNIKNNRLYLQNLCTLVAKNCALLFTIFCALLLTDYIGVGTEYLYRVSEIITKDYFNILPIDKQQAWCYPSVQSKQAFNVCFRPKIHREVLELKGVSLCIMKKVNSEIRIGAAKASLEFNDNGEFVFVAPNDENMKVLFPHPNSI